MRKLAKFPPEAQKIPTPGQDCSWIYLPTQSVKIWIYCCADCCQMQKRVNRSQSTNQNALKYIKWISQTSWLEYLYIQNWLIETMLEVKYFDALNKQVTQSAQWQGHLLSCQGPGKYDDATECTQTAQRHASLQIMKYFLVSIFLQVSKTRQIYEQYTNT